MERSRQPRVIALIGVLIGVVFAGLLAGIAGVAATARPAAAVTVGSQPLQNSDFQTGDLAHWTLAPASGNTTHVVTGGYADDFRSTSCGDNGCSDGLAQSFTIPASFTTARLEYAYRVATADFESGCFDTLVIGLADANGSLPGNGSASAPQLCQNNQGTAWHRASLDLTTALRARAAGSTATIAFAASTDGSGPTTWDVDQVILHIDEPGPPADPLAIATGAGSVTLTWGAPDTGAQPTIYSVFDNTTGEAHNVAVTARTYTFSGLPTGATQTFSVLAGNNGGGSAVTANPVLASASTPLRAAVSDRQYSLSGSNGTTWQDLDTVNLVTSFTAPSNGTMILDGNADLWTATAGVNQDLGLRVISTDPKFPDDIVGWKESGGFAGTFSPNAAATTAAIPVVSGITYVVRLDWKANKNAPTSTIFAGAGPIGLRYSPTRLGLRFVSGTSANELVAPKVSTPNDQYHLTGSDGATWVPIDEAHLTPSVTPTATGTAKVTLNADLWTASSGINQDLGITYAGSNGTSGLLAWKESGGFAGTFSPNAALVVGTLPLAPNVTYVFKAVWKANKPAPGKTIYAGAGGPGAFSPLSLTVVTDPAGFVGGTPATSQPVLAGSDGATWTTTDAHDPSVALSTSVGQRGFVLLTASADLWTETAGFNQDLGIRVTTTDSGLNGAVLGWKESGGFAGTFSPNAASITVLVPVHDANTYTFTLVWKMNKAAPPSAKIHIGAGASPTFSPTSLTATTFTEHGAPF